MSKTILELKFRVGGPLKRHEIIDWISIMNEIFNKKEGYNIELLNYYYEDHRAVDAGLYLFLILGAIADIFTIFIAIRELIRKEPRIEELTLKTKDKEIQIKGNMTDEELINLLKEGKNFE